MAGKARESTRKEGTAEAETEQQLMGERRETRVTELWRDNTVDSRIFIQVELAPTGHRKEREGPIVRECAPERIIEISNCKTRKIESFSELTPERDVYK